MSALAQSSAVYSADSIATKRLKVVIADDHPLLLADDPSLLDAAARAMENFTSLNPGRSTDHFRWPVVESFTYRSLAGVEAALEVTGCGGAGTASDTALVVRHGAHVLRVRAARDRGREWEHAPRSAWWRATFEVPLHIVEHPEARFALSAVLAGRRIAVALAAPELQLRPEVSASLFAGTALWRLRRHAAALAAGVASAAAVSAGTVAAADTTATVTDAPSAATVTDAPSATTTTDAATPTVPGATTTDTGTATAPTGTSTVATTTSASTATTDVTTSPTTGATPTATTTSSTPAPATPPVTTTDAPSASTPQSTPGTPSPAAPTMSVAPQPTSTAGTPAASSTKPAAKLNLTPQKRATQPGARLQAPTAKPNENAHNDPNPSEAAPHHIPATLIPPRPRIPARRNASTSFAAPAQEVSSSAAESLAALPASWVAAPVLDPFTAAQIAHYETLGASLDQPPAFLIPTYKQAGRRYGIPWQILAAINAIETDYGRNVATSSAGAIGFMQFEPATWMQYGIAADGHSDPNPYNARDAIFSAARYLADHGGAHHLREAIFAYNHAIWYVDAVLWRAQAITDRALAFHGHRHGYALPLDARYMEILGRTDEGVDIEDAPDGAAVYSITTGIVTAVASDPSGFGPDYPVVTATSGPLAGQSIYYGHVAASLVHVGDKVLAGEPIAVMGHTGDAASLGHGHIEIGFSDGSGDPLSHGVATPAGDAMRHVLVALSALYRVANS